MDAATLIALTISNNHARSFNQDRKTEITSNEQIIKTVNTNIMKLTIKNQRTKRSAKLRGSIKLCSILHHLLKMRKKTMIPSPLPVWPGYRRNWTIRSASWTGNRGTKINLLENLQIHKRKHYTLYIYATYTLQYLAK